MRRCERDGYRREHRRSRFPRFLFRTFLYLVGAVFFFYLIVLITAWVK